MKDLKLNPSEVTYLENGDVIFPDYINKIIDKMTDEADAQVDEMRRMKSMSSVRVNSMRK